MKFATIDINRCEGCYLAHSLHTGHKRIGKGTKITADIVAQLAESGTAEVLVAQLEEGDTHEDEAALTVAARLSGSEVTLSNARTGRVNLLAAVEGLCHFDSQAIIEANAIDEGITIATISANQWVAKGRMVATIKIIPYAVSSANVQQVLSVLAERTLSVITPVAHKVVLIQTRLNSIKDSVLDKTRRVTENRLDPRGAQLIHESRCLHEVNELSVMLNESLQNNPDWILVVGASAISDRADVIPQAIVKAGGCIDRYGIPVDPGNLLLLAHIGSTLLIGLPGCARSARYNGLDMVIDRIACEVPITNDWLNTLSIGGLLAEIADRPAPRIDISDQRQVSAIILAAGSSRRAGPQNKLLAPFGNDTIVSHIAKAVCNSQAQRVIAITGHEAPRVMDALATTPVECHYNAAHSSGMASSVITGVSELIDTDGVLVCLGDMPHITSSDIDLLIAAFQRNTNKSIFVPVVNNQRGNPVLFSRLFFDTLLTLEGDVGARKLIQEYPDEVYEVSVESNGILVDYDTQDDLISLSSHPGS